MPYVFGGSGLVQDPYASAEFEQIQATLKAIQEQLNAVSKSNSAPTEAPDTTKPSPPGDPDNPDQTTPPAVIGQRWITGPWILGVDGSGIPSNIPYYSVVKPPSWDSDQHNFHCSGLDNAVLLEAYPNTTLTLTGIRISKRHRRILGIYNRGGGTLKIKNQATTESSSIYCFSWGTTGDVGEFIEIPSGIVVWLLYDPVVTRWKLFAIPSVGADNLPPSLTPSASTFPPNYDWFASRWYREVTTGAIGIGEQAPTPSGTLAATVGIEGNGIRTTTGAVIGNQAGVGTGTPATSIQPISGPDWTTIVATGASVADQRIWVVWSTIAPSNTDDLPGGGTAQHFGFRFSTPAGDSSWVGSSRDGTTQSVTAAVGASVTVNTTYKLRVRKVNSSLFFSVNDSAEIEKTTNLPAETTSLNWYCIITTTAAATKSIVWYRHHCRFLASEFAP